MVQGTNWVAAYDADPAVIFSLDNLLMFVRCNPAWDRFATANGAPQLTGQSVLGTCIMDVLPRPLRAFYTTAYDAVRKFRRPWWHIFECSSPEVSRFFQMRVLPDGANGILVVNTLLMETPHPRQIAARLEEYTDADGIVTLCANCRRAEHLTLPGRWDFIPLLLHSGQALIKPGLCPFCSHYHYPGQDRVL